ncbi:ABC transporter permease [Halovivax gelatinilyticus]|uniref:ABC transporter permease n=1 Tax=Halovivax gelatinilyticus TaxID=2961597 RepID=UPI0020CA4854|nr:ABC transporter permease [Halovivax gelatinilyticus]
MVTKSGHGYPASTVEATDGEQTGRLIATRRLTRAVFAKQLILLKRYWINTSMLLVTMYVFFAMIFYGGQAAAGPAIESSLDGIVVGFFLFTASLAAFFATAQDIQREAQWGTLEQLFMSPHGIGQVMAVKSVWNVAFSVGLSFVLLSVMLATTDRALSIDVLTITVITVLAVASVLGIGFLFAGLSLLYKRIENVQQIMQFGFIGLIAVPATETSRLMGLLPLSQGSAMLHASMTENVALWEFQAGDLAILTAAGLLYLCAGYLTFHLCVRRARRLGVMGHY